MQPAVLKNTNYRKCSEGSLLFTNTIRIVSGIYNLHNGKKVLPKIVPVSIAKGDRIILRSYKLRTANKKHGYPGIIGAKINAVKK